MRPIALERAGVEDPAWAHRRPSGIVPGGRVGVTDNAKWQGGLGEEWDNTLPADFADAARQAAAITVQSSRAPFL